MPSKHLYLLVLHFLWLGRMVFLTDYQRRSRQTQRLAVKLCDFWVFVEIGGLVKRYGSSDISSIHVSPSVE